MNKLVLFVIVSALLFHSSLAQKPLIDIHVKSWGGIGNYLISDNGEYIAYNISESSGLNLFIRSTLSEWRMTVSRAMLVAITQDSRKVVFRSGVDSVGIIDLNSSHALLYLEGIKTCRVVKWGHDNDLLIYTLKERPDQLIIREIENGKEKTYSCVDNYWTSDDGNVVVLETIKQDSAVKKCVLNWLNVKESELHTIWEGRKVGDLKIGYSGSQCVFTMNSGTDTSVNSIWHYRTTDDKAVEVLDGHSDSLYGMTIKGISAFNDKCGRIFVNLGQSKIMKESSVGSAAVDVWSYKDAMLQPEQLKLLSGRHNLSINYKAVYNIGDHRIIRLEYERENIERQWLYRDKAQNYVLLTKDGGGTPYEWNWNIKSKKAIYLVNLNNGNRRLIAEGLSGEAINGYVLSYNEHYIFYYDSEVKGYFSYRISDGARKNMTVGVKGYWKVEDFADEPAGRYYSYSTAGMIKNSDAILVYDRNDVFKLDPTSRILAKNLTKIEGQSHDFVFRLLTDGNMPIIDSNERVCLSVFNKADKAACLTGVSIVPISPLRSLKFEPYCLNSRLPLKARDKDVYIVVRMSAEKSPNLFLTSDFTNYRAVTDVYPESQYNWLKSELITWKTYDGGVSQGILYKPENFDPQKKYPLIVYYYERLSDNLHGFITPGLSEGLLNIPFYVSHGYLVFEPDIHYRIGWPGRSAYNCVVSGVQYLAKRSYVDTKRMGLQGHSFGGFETNYILTHSNLFAAAMSSSGMSDFVSAYGSVLRNGTSRQRQYELYRDRIGATLWERPDLYIENSPVFRANKVTTPLLMMTNYGDGDVPCQQGIEFFTALRRLGKKAWMLQYDGEGHVVFSEAAQEDLTVRMAQFFNCYLKGEPPPKWMTSGVPASVKGFNSGIEIDSSGIKP